MRPAILLAALLAVTLAGCLPTARQLPAEQPPPATSTVECLTVSPDALEGIQWGLDDRNGPDSGISATRTAAILNPNDPATDSWLVAVEFTGPGIPVGSSGTWYTLQDPTSAGTFAYLSVDAVAVEFSSYAQPAAASSAYPGVADVKACLG